VIVLGAWAKRLVVWEGIFFSGLGQKKGKKIGEKGAAKKLLCPNQIIELHCVGSDYRFLILFCSIISIWLKSIT
jgi:hypothetical protein